MGKGAVGPVERVATVGHRHKLVDLWRARQTVRERLVDALAAQVAHELTAHTALDAHLRDELGITAHSEARPLQAALASATAFVVGALPPIALVMLWHGPGLTTLLVGATLVLLAALGAVAARLGGAPMVPGALRVLLWGALAMGASAAIGKLFGAGPVG